ncbi:hypothetical protein [uncultured Methanosphaera sp.]|uniref:hypothetical protein n=1 Tax=uncultured Methanosphaera sp. TaxID=262501 RepID=UPI00280AFE42|nr:hypothetical protein [uncultured Methanosphaera sp.]
MIITLQKYEGDRQLDSMTFTDELTQQQYIIYWAEVIRTLAYMTHRQMKFNDTIRVGYGTYDNGTRYVREIIDENGNKIEKLDESRSDLTDEEKSYFDNYDDLREEYLAKLARDDSDSYYPSHSSSGSKSGIFIGSRGSGYYRSL